MPARVVGLTNTRTLFELVQTAVVEICGERTHSARGIMA